MLNATTIRLWNHTCRVWMAPTGIVRDRFYGEVTLTVPQSLAQHFQEDEDGQISSCSLVTKGERAAFFFRDGEDGQGCTTYSARFTFPVGQSCSLLTRGGHAFATWKLHESGEAEMTYAQFTK